MRLMYDSDTPGAIPAGVMRAGYIDGVNPWPPGMPMDVRIARNSLTDDGHAADIEGGAMPLSYFLNWAARRLRSLPAVTAYVNRANGKDVENACLAAGYTPTSGQVLLWISTLDGTRAVTHWNDGSPVRFPVIGVQYASAAMSGGHYDISEVADYWPGVDMTQAEFDALLAANPGFTALSWRLEALLNNRATVAEGPTKGEVNALKAELDAIKAGTGGGIPPGTTFTATTK